VAEQDLAAGLCGGLLPRLAGSIGAGGQETLPTPRIGLVHLHLHGGRPGQVE
jgi:hypothetical protein